jgi:hypothetical protein
MPTIKKQWQGKVRLVAMVQVGMICSEKSALTVGTLEGEFVGDAYDKEEMQGKVRLVDMAQVEMLVLSNLHAPWVPWKENL